MATSEIHWLVHGCPVMEAILLWLVVCIIFSNWCTRCLLVFALFTVYLMLSNVWMPLFEFAAYMNMRFIFCSSVWLFSILGRLTFNRVGLAFAAVFIIVKKAVNDLIVNMVVPNTAVSSWRGTCLLSAPYKDVFAVCIFGSENVFDNPHASNSGQLAYSLAVPFYNTWQFNTLIA